MGKATKAITKGVHFECKLLKSPLRCNSVGELTKKPTQQNILAKREKPELNVDLSESIIGARRRGRGG